MRRLTIKHVEVVSDVVADGAVAREQRRPEALVSTLEGCPGRAVSE